jgi:soluble lytic murein transglycosylase-like protein
VREEPLRLLAGAAAGALATVADTEQWPDLRARVAAVLAPGLVDLVSARMDEARRRLVAVPPARRELARAEFTTEWRGSIHAMLWERPEAAGPLRAVLHDVSPGLPRAVGDFAAGAGTARR